MPVRPIVKFPDPLLRAVADPVKLFDSDLRDLAGDLIDTMHAAPGIGITGPHIGILKRLVVIQVPPATNPSVYANPSIVEASSQMMRHTEGSVSMPGVTEEIERHARVRIRYQDLEGKEHFEDAEGLLAVCHQHEIDQLDGVFWIHRLSRLKRDRLIKRYGKLTR
ncbi:peptide deformylase [Mesorhizobium sp. M2D.F.Ca.ET.185.01.1.1]|uniref:peptide deformylase n=2 Tax=Mesorhizobium TaxID=68287 RepID=UPI000FCC65DC|nr:MULTISPECIES: peptide deformylase [unclassified Mesorhizobium]TGP80571.1 peptide deformylase [bacterium M00.F.Ca.ET.227.01.1.1]TGQ00459.1 peptide deformylase [bacterium M00.F.Ca.ET.221.01.1.1]TGQ03017.1 peptide deformylase [bacterium M00.F.Ca.ET.222.01.1.1]TGU09409.1 peptide deformylase [bacterium M00.F.Ca.ET.163.01.1.1]TGU32646.1 peptide deformylase [bacterium M00.F.Ca.ET.156.01.1.1]TGU44009.1 peptide deformylase [bacterium M00.F.Ca.ET.146.01.1.1]TGV72634.1 peptide deformylase [Mesorhizo